MYLDDFAERANKRGLDYEEPVKYLAGRGFDKEDIKRFGFGYLKVANIKEEKTEEYKKFYDETYKFKALENRILIPLKNLLGHVNGLVVRSIKEKRYKLYLLNEAKAIGGWFGLYEAVPHILKTKRVFIHEGAFDSAAFSKVFQNTASSLTSFLNDQQYETLRMLADLIILVYDEDKAGQIGVAALKKRYGKCIESVSIGYKDTNSCLEKMGYAPFVKFMKSKIPFMLQN
jgi:DNA primase